MSSRPGLDDDVAALARIDALGGILDIACRTTGMGFAAVACLAEDRWVACAVRDEIGLGLQPGSELPALVFRGHPTPSDDRSEGFISAPVRRPNGTLFGVLCCLDPKPAHVNRPEIVGMLGLLAQLIGFHIDANERAVEAQDVRRSGALLEGLLAASPDCVKVLSSDGILEFMNERGLELNHFACAADVLGRKFSSLWPQSERDAIDQAIAQAAAGAIARIEAFGPTARGEERWWEASFAPFRLQETGVVKIVGISRDITGRVQAEAARRATAGTLRDLTETLAEQVAQRTQERDRIWQVSQDMLGVADRDGVWRSINPAWTRILGWPAEDVLGRDSTWLEPPEAAGSWFAGLTGDPDRPSSFESRFRTLDGSYRLLSWIAVPAGGSLYCVARDVTADRVRDAALRDSRDFTRLALSAVSGVGVWTYEAATDRFVCDAAIAQLYGLDPAEAAAGVPREVFIGNVHPEDMPALKAMMAGGLLRSGDLELEYRIRHPDGSLRWVLSRGHTYFDAAGVPVRRTGVGIDMTSQRRLEEQLRQSQKMEAVGQLTGGVAHDFNNLLTVIRSSSDLLKRPNLSEDRRQRYIAAISDTAARGAKLTAQLLAFARRQALQASVFDVALSLRAIGDMLATLTGPRIRIDMHLPNVGCFVNADPSQLDTSLVNLAVNARDAMHGEGTLTIAVGTASQIPELRAHPAVPGQFVTVSISDTGSGIAPESLERIFEPFFTTKEVGQGTGLGLSQVFGFVKQSGGDVAVVSDVGRGTTFTLYLPRVDAGAEPTDPDHKPGLPEEGHGTCVLVVEDNPDVGLFATQTLAELGYQSVLARNAGEALDILASNASGFDVVFSDVIMPGVNGIDLAQEIRRRYDDLPVVLTSGYSHVLAQNGPLGFELLQKPYSLEQLSRVLSKAAHWRRLKRVQGD